MVLPAPLEPAFADQISGPQMVQLIRLVQSFAGHVIIDMPAFFNDVVLSLLEASDDIILVAGLDIPNIKNVKLGLSTLALLDIPREKLHLVLNRAVPRSNLMSVKLKRPFRSRPQRTSTSDGNRSDLGQQGFPGCSFLGKIRGCSSL